jgi:3-phosphoshikimate 1-carboxyvinyltransferase
VDHAVPSPLTARRAGALKGRLRVPGDKSISHRALIFGALTVGETHISGLLEGEDVINTAKAMRALGATVERIGEGTWRVRGVGVGGFREPQAVLDFGNSGTGCRLVMGAVAGCPVTATFDGDASLRKRPMRRILDPVELIGARTVSATDGGRLPITLAGARDPLPVVYRTPVPSAQIKSAVLLAGLAAPGETVVIETEASRDHTERLLKHFGADIVVEADGAGTAPVFVPERIERIRTTSHLRDDRIHANGTDILLVASTPTVDHEMLTARWVQALNAEGETLALVEFGVGRRVDAQVLRDVTARPSVARRSTAIRVMV